MAKERTAAEVKKIKVWINTGHTGAGYEDEFEVDGEKYYLYPVMPEWCEEESDN